MQIFVDADSCPVVAEVESVASWHDVPVTLLCDTNHALTSDYSKIVVIGAGADAVDFALVTRCEAGDIVITQDYGLAAMAVARGARVLHPDGWLYTEENIDGLIQGRHSNYRARHLLYRPFSQVPHKRTQEDDDNFAVRLDELLSKAEEGEWTDVDEVTPGKTVERATEEIPDLGYGRPLPKAGEVWHHFKGKQYKIIACPVIHTETRELYCVYQALYGDYGIFCRPLDMFMSEVDRKKYPEAQQRYRFERQEA